LSKGLHKQLTCDHMYIYVLININYLIIKDILGASKIEFFSVASMSTKIMMISCILATLPDVTSLVIRQMKVLTLR